MLRIVVSIGGTEVFHFAIWMDTAGNAPSLDTGDGLVFPDLNADPATQTNQIMPQACTFLSADLPRCSIIRPSAKENAGALAGFKDSGLFTGQSPKFFHTLHKLAKRADAAVRSLAS